MVLCFSGFFFLKVSKNKKDIEKQTNSVAIAPSGQVMPEVVIDKIKNELTFIDETGKPFSIKTRIIEEEPEEDESSYPPMSSEDFEKALRAVDALGLTWTADAAPGVKPKSGEAEDAFLSPEFEEIQERYPRLPYEVFLATSSFLTGSSAYTQAAGGEDSLKKKAAIAGELIVDKHYRNQFFFRSAIKVPYLRDIDWEIVSKLYEKGVEGTPGIAYGLLALSLQDPFYTSRAGTLRHITVAVDETLVSHLLEILTEVKTWLEQANGVKPTS